MLERCAIDLARKLCTDARPPPSAPITNKESITVAQSHFDRDTIINDHCCQYLVVRCPRHTIQSQGYGYAEYVRRVIELVGVARDGIKWEEYEKWYPYVLPRRGD
jgi:hypothetical protein